VEGAKECWEGRKAHREQLYVVFFGKVRKAQSGLIERSGRRGVAAARALTVAQLELR